MSPKGRWVQNGLRMEGIRRPPTGSANLVIGKSPVERGTARAYLYTLEAFSPYNCLPWVDTD